MLCIIIDFLETSILFEKFLTMIALHKNICLFQVQLNLELGGPLVWQFCVKVLPLRHKLMEFTAHGSIFPKGDLHFKKFLLVSSFHVSGRRKGQSPSGSRECHVLDVNFQVSLETAPESFYEITLDRV